MKPPEVIVRSDGSASIRCYHDPHMNNWAIAEARALLDPEDQAAVVMAFPVKQKKGGKNVKP